MGFDHPEGGTDNVARRIARLPQRLHLRDGASRVPLGAALNDFANCLGMGLIADFEDDSLIDQSILCQVEGGLEIVEGVTHVAFGGKQDCFQTIFGVADILRLADAQETLQDIFIRETGVAQDGSPTLDGFNDFGGIVTGEAESSAARVNLHGTTEGLLCRPRHTVGLIQDNNLVAIIQEFQ